MSVTHTSPLRDRRPRTTVAAVADRTAREFLPNADPVLARVTVSYLFASEFEETQ